MENKKITVLVVVALAVVPILYLLLMMFVTSGGQRQDASRTTGSQSTGAQPHDETNSDGHHSSTSDISSTPVVDLTSQSQVAIEIKDFAYSQQNIKIKKGTTVTWTNQDTVEHNVMKEHANDGDAHDAPSKNEINPNVVAGPLLAKGESYSFTFNQISENPYHCSPHPYMKGSVTVVQ